MSIELFLWQANEALELVDASLHLQNASILGVLVGFQGFDLSLNAFVLALLLTFCPFHVCLDFILFVKNGILGLSNVHLQDSPTCVLFGTDNRNLLLMVF